MNGRLDLEEVLDYIFEAVCRMMLLGLFLCKDKGRNIPSTEPSSIGAMSKVDGAKELRKIGDELTALA